MGPTSTSPYAASRIRGMVARVPFEEFHKHSSEIIQTAVLGKDKDGKLREELRFSANNLVRASSCTLNIWEPSNPFTNCLQSLV